MYICTYAHWICTYGHKLSNYVCMVIRLCMCASKYISIDVYIHIAISICRLVYAC